MGRIYVGYMQIFHHFIERSWSSEDFVMRGRREAWNQSPIDTEG
jgi:hypothetical protein